MEKDQHTCEECGRVLTEADRLQNESENGSGYPAACEDCAELDARLTSADHDARREQEQARDRLRQEREARMDVVTGLVVKAVGLLDTGERELLRQVLVDIRSDGRDPGQRIVPALLGISGSRLHGTCEGCGDDADLMLSKGWLMCPACRAQDEAAASIIDDEGNLLT